MSPVIAIIGRSNVGKSTLFNRLTRSQRALVLDSPGVTRDRQYGQGALADNHFIVIDSGGIGDGVVTEMQTAILKQTQAAMIEADMIYFVVDGRAGLTPIDTEIAKALRKITIPI